MFVDDCDMVQTAPSVQESGEDILPQVQQATDCWEGLLKASGGAISPTKSFWYLVDYVYTGGKWRYRSKDEMPGDLTVLDAAGVRQTLTRHEPDHAEKTLGVFMAMDGNNEGEIEYLTGKVKDFAAKIRASQNKLRNDVWVAVKTTIMKTLEYPMAALTLTKAQWDKIMWHLLRVCLPCSGFAATFPHTVLYGPTEFGGLGLFHPWYNQELTHLETFWEEISMDSHTGQLLMSSVEILKLELGMFQPLTSVPFEDFHPLATDCWMKTLWHSCQLFDMELEEPTPDLGPRRLRDRALMEVFYTLGHYTGQDLAMLNECRSFLQAVSISDIASADGTRIHFDAYSGIAPSSNQGSFHWPRQPSQLSTAHWTLWQQALEKCVIDSGSTTKRLRQSLGPWLSDPTPLWNWFYSADDDGPVLYCRHEHSFIPYCRRGRSRLVFVPSTEHPAVSELPPDCELASVIRDGQQVRLHSHAPIRLVPPSNTPSGPATLQAAVETLPEADRWAVSTLFSTHEGHLIAEAIRRGKAIAVSDGSYKEGFGTSAFVIESLSTGQRVKGCNIAPGHVDDQSSHRSELSGIAGIVTTLSLLSSLHDLDGGSLEIGLDNKSAGKSVFCKWEPTVKQADFDMIYDLRQKIKSLPLHLTVRWIASHQDKGDDVDYSDFDHWTMLNIEMDLLAGEHLEANRHVPNANPTFSHERVAVRLAGRKLSRFDKTFLYSQVFGRSRPFNAEDPGPKKEWPLMEYWKDRHDMSDQDVAAIHWAAHGKAFRGIPFGLQRWLSKHSTGQCGVGRMKMRRKHQDHSECPRCLQEDETTTHVITCGDARATACWNLQIQKLRQWLSENKTSPDLEVDLIGRLQAWRAGRPPPALTTTSAAVSEAIEEQDSIGWWNFLLGRVSRKFAEVQSEHFKSIQSRRTGRPWLTGLIRQVWDLSFQMWEHRNNILHSDYSPHQLAKLERLRTQAREQFLQGTRGLLPQDHHFLQDKYHVLALDLPSLEVWCKSVSLAREAQPQTVLLQRRRLSKARAFMQSWLFSNQPSDRLVHNSADTSPSLEPPAQAPALSQAVQVNTPSPTP